VSRVGDAYNVRAASSNTDVVKLESLSGINTADLVNAIRIISPKAQRVTCSSHSSETTDEIETSENFEATGALGCKDSDARQYFHVNCSGSVLESKVMAIFLWLAVPYAPFGPPLETVRRISIRA
jgi:hypothetical protein